MRRQITRFYARGTQAARSRASDDGAVAHMWEVDQAREHAEEVLAIFEEQVDEEVVERVEIVTPVTNEQDPSLVTEQFVNNAVRRYEATFIPEYLQEQDSMGGDVIADPVPTSQDWTGLNPLASWRYRYDSLADMFTVEVRMDRNLNQVGRQVMPGWQVVSAGAPMRQVLVAEANRAYATLVSTTNTTDSTIIFQNCECDTCVRFRREQEQRERADAAQ